MVTGDRDTPWYCSRLAESRIINQFSFVVKSVIIASEKCILRPQRVSFETRSHTYMYLLITFYIYYIFNKPFVLEMFAIEFLFEKQNFSRVTWIQVNMEWIVYSKSSNEYYHSRKKQRRNKFKKKFTFIYLTRNMTINEWLISKLLDLCSAW